MIRYLLILSIALFVHGEIFATCTSRAIPQLTDVLKSSGIDFVHTSAPEKKYILESMSGGVLLLDYDRDGLLDIYFTNAPTVEMAIAGKQAKSRLYKNLGNMKFRDVTDKAGVGNPGFAMGGAVADYNNDGYPDIYVTNFGKNTLYENLGNGKFKDVSEKAGIQDERWSAGAAFGDYDGDGFLDLAVANYVDFSLSDLPGFGKLPTCKFRGVDVQCGPRGLKGAGDSVYRNNGDGTFTDVTKKLGFEDPEGFYGMQPIWSDFGNDGKAHLYVANDSTPNFFYQNEGSGKFSEIGLLSGTGVSGDGSEQGSMGVAIGDFLNNGKFAIYTTNFVDEYNTLYRNDGAFEFTDVSFKTKVAQPSRPYVGWGTGFFDIDNDMWLDLFVVNGHVYPQMDNISSGASYKQGKLLFINKGNGEFCEGTRQAGTAVTEKRVSRGAAFGDIDNDGDVDIVVEDLDGAPMLLRNDAPKKNGWVNLELGAVTGNRLAIGAMVKLTAGGITQTAEIRSGSSYLSQDDFRLHFGLGAAKTIDSIEIRWPSGKKEVLKNVKINQFVSILEGKGVVKRNEIMPKK